MPGANKRVCSSAFRVSVLRSRTDGVYSDEESTHQMQTSMSTFQQQSQNQALNQPIPQIKIESESAYNFNPPPPIQTAPPPFLPNDFYPATQLQLSPSNVNGNPSELICSSCSQERQPNDVICWNCFSPLPSAPTPLQSQNIYPTLDPLQIQQIQYAQRVKSEEEAMARQQQQQRQLQQRQSQPQRLPSVDFLLRSTCPVKPQPLQPPQQLQDVAIRQAHVQAMAQLAQQRLQQPTQTLSSYNRSIRDSSNIINIHNSLSASIPLQTNYSTPASALALVKSYLNNGLVVPNHNAVAQKMGPAPGSVPYQSNYPQPYSDTGISSAKEIKDLLSNIRPDEDIKVEDQDAIFPGLAQHMRLMKHQQAVLFKSSSDY